MSELTNLLHELWGECKDGVYDKKKWTQLQYLIEGIGKEVIPPQRYYTTHIPILDHGWVKYKTHWGSDEDIIEAARESVDRGFVSWEPYEDHPKGDAGLLAYLWKKQHTTPFEMAGLIVRVQAPIMVFREWHRHRTQCLAPDSLIHFDSPKSKGNRRFVYKMMIEDIWRKWQPTTRKERPERQVNPFHKRNVLQRMFLRNLDETEHEIRHNRIVDVIRSEPKDMLRVICASGKEITATPQHKFFTKDGWTTLEEAITGRIPLAVEGTTRGKITSWEVDPIDYSKECWIKVAGYEDLYLISNMGRVKTRDGKLRKTPIAPNGYPVVSLCKHGVCTLFTVHSLVLTSFKREKREGEEARHINHNRADCRLSNLEWGSSKRNTQDMLESDRQQRLVPTYEQIVEVRSVGKKYTYDLSVKGPYHNFIANGFVVHNSYNEMSARYTPLPDVNYVPSIERCMMGKDTRNKQAQGTGVELTEGKAGEWLSNLYEAYNNAQKVYQQGLDYGVPKELARLILPVGRYSRMRASANLLNWLRFCKLRCASDAQEEIRVFANAVRLMLTERFPRTMDLFNETGLQGINQRGS